MSILIVFHPLIKSEYNYVKFINITLIIKKFKADELNLRNKEIYMDDNMHKKVLK